MSDTSVWLGITGAIILIVFSPLLIGLLVMGGQKSVRVIHSQSGLTKEGYVGYCTTYFFFGFLVPLFRGEIGVSLMHLVLTTITFGIFQLVMPFLYNKHYMTRLITNGWELYDSPERNDLARMKLGIVAPHIGHR